VVRDGVVRDGVVRDGAVRDGAVRDGAGELNPGFTVNWLSVPAVSRYATSFRQRTLNAP
jgi:hypothetical protein